MVDNNATFSLCQRTVSATLSITVLLPKLSAGSEDVNKDL